MTATAKSTRAQSAIRPNALQKVRVIKTQASCSKDGCGSSDRVIAGCKKAGAGTESDKKFLEWTRSIIETARANGFKASLTPDQIQSCSFVIFDKVMARSELRGARAVLEGLVLRAEGGEYALAHKVWHNEHGAPRLCTVQICLASDG